MFLWSLTWRRKPSHHISKRYIFSQSTLIKTTTLWIEAAVGYLSRCFIVAMHITNERHARSRRRMRSLRVASNLALIWHLSRETSTMRLRSDSERWTRRALLLPLAEQLLPLACNYIWSWSIVLVVCISSVMTGEPSFNSPRTSAIDNSVRPLSNLSTRHVGHTLWSTYTFRRLVLWYTDSFYSYDVFTVVTVQR